MTAHDDMMKTLMDKMEELKTSGKFDDMDAEAKKKFMASAMFM